MAKYQGLHRLQEGFKKRLTQSEAKKGYIFITKDTAVFKLLGRKFDVLIDGELSENKTIDNSGRIYIGRTNTSKLADNLFFLKISGNKIIIEE